MNGKRKEIYVSVDIEADGRIPGHSSMLSFGSAALTLDKELVATFEANLETLEGASPFGISGLCLKSYASVLLECDYRAATKRNFPRRWFDDRRHTHVALDDAIEQGAMGINMLREGRGLPPVRGIEDRGAAVELEI